MIRAIPIPQSSLMDPAKIATACFSDCYKTPITKPDAKPVDLFFAIFGHQPGWMKAILILRNQIAALCGLATPTIADIANPQIKTSYVVGDKIGPWPIFALSDVALVAGRDNSHLDFRLSVLRQREADGCSVVVATICNTHNIAGKIYLFFITPFHRRGVQRLIANAVRAGRL